MPASQFSQCLEKVTDGKMRQTRLKRMLAWLVFLCVFAVKQDGLQPPPDNWTEEMANAEGLAARTAKKVLVLFPYQTDMPHTVLATRSLRAEFAKAQDLDVELYVEHLDLNRFAEEDCKEQFLRLLEAKYGRHPADLVLLTGESPLAFWLNHREKILPDAPAVFYDLMTERLTAYQPLPPGITGLSSQIDHLSSVRWLLHVRPKVRELVIVRGAGEADDQEDIRAVDVLKEELRGQIKITDWHNLPLEAMKQSAAALPPSAAILYHLMFEDAAGNKFRPIDALRELAQTAAVPVLSGYDQFIGTGTVGGCMYSIEQKARSAARLGLRILHGEAASSLPVTTGGENQFMFDHPALIRHGIPLSALPPDSMVMNRQHSLWEEHRSKIIAVAVVVFGLILVIVILVGLIRQLNKTKLALSGLNAGLETQVYERTKVLSQTNRRLEQEVKERIQAEQALLTSEARYRLLADNAPIAVAVTGLSSGEVLYANEKAIRLFAAEGQSLVNSQAADWYVDPKDRETLLRHLAEQGWVNDFEIKARRFSGEEFWISVTSHRSVFENRPAIHSVCLEITDRKKAEAERERLIAELRQALSKVRQLEGILPICCFCKKIRDADGEWHVLEQYIGRHSEAQFSHGFCQECAKKHYPEVFSK